MITTVLAFLAAAASAMALAIVLWRRIRPSLQARSLRQMPVPASSSLAPAPDWLSAESARPGDDAYAAFRYQYATTSFSPAEMSPGMIVRPRAPDVDADVKRVLKYARENQLSVVIRTGGNAYNGSSSCAGDAIQLDLREAYRDWAYCEASGTVRLGVSFSLKEVYERLRRIETTPGHALFIPCGQCFAVNVGGHAQTGGYGMLSRAFGLFSDHIVSAEIITADGETRIIAPDARENEDRELFRAVFGGGPGCFGIVTHLTIRPLRDEDYLDSRSYRVIIPYAKGQDRWLMKALLELVQAFEAAPRGYDFCVTWASAEEAYFANVFGLTSQPDAQGPPEENFSAPPYPGIALYFQYSNPMGPDEVYDPSWCRRIKDLVQQQEQTLSGRLFAAFARSAGPTPDDDEHVPISQAMAEYWTFRARREFNYPARKFLVFTDQVASPDYAEWCVDAVDSMLKKKGIMMFLQSYPLGGEASMYRRNGLDGKNAFAWRNTHFAAALDVFYDPRHADAVAVADSWHQRIAREATGPSGKICTEDRRWYWAAHGEKDMDKLWAAYYDSPEGYRRALAVKDAVDPLGVFSATPFHLGYAERKQRRAMKQSDSPGQSSGSGAPSSGADIVTTAVHPGALGAEEVASADPRPEVREEPR